MKKHLLLFVVLSLILVTVLPLSGCGSGVTINVFNWAEYIDESLIDEFENKPELR